MTLKDYTKYVKENCGPSISLCPLCEHAVVAGEGGLSNVVVEGVVYVAHWECTKEVDEILKNSSDN